MQIKKKIVMSLLGNIGNDHRVLKEIKTLQDAGYRIVVVTNKNEPCDKRVSRLFKETLVIKIGLVRRTHRPLNLVEKFLDLIKILYGQIDMIFTLCRSKPDILHAHDINTLIPATIAKFLTKAKLVYDCHEFALDRVGYQNKKLLVFCIESKLLPFVDKIITVSNGISIAYKHIYNIQKPVILENFPNLIHGSSERQIHNASAIKKLWGISESDSIILYQGGLTEGRGLFCLIKSIIYVKKNVQFVLIGSGPLRIPLEEYARNLKVDDRIIFQDNVRLSDLENYTKTASICVHPLENRCFNHRWSSPNKLYEYIHAGIPVIMSNLPGPFRTISRWKVGNCFAADDHIDLANKITDLLSNSEAYGELKKNCENAKIYLDWKAQQHKLLNLYEDIS